MKKSNDAATTEQVLEPLRELTENELAQVSGGIIAILIGRSDSTAATVNLRDQSS